VLPDDPIEKVRLKIAMRGYRFSVEENWISRMSPEERSHFFLRRGPVDESIRRALAVRLPVEPDLPVSFDLRNVDGRNYLHGITETQNDYGRGCADCYAFATMAAAEGTYNRWHDFSGFQTVNFSETHLAWVLGYKTEADWWGNHQQKYPGFAGCSGADASFDQLKALVEDGAVYEVDCPYTSASPPTGCDVPSENLIGFSGFEVLDGTQAQIKTAIYRFGPVYATVYADSTFMMYGGGAVFEDGHRQCSNRPEDDTYHAVALVGWDDGDGVEPGHWIVRNSWSRERNGGALWGENGYMRLAYGDAMSSCEVGMLRYSAPPPPPPEDNTQLGCFITQLFGE
jgi:hypothetical protein